MTSVAATKLACYRVTQVDRGWHVTRPIASMAHAFDTFDDALTFIRKDSGGEATVEILAGTVYMVKQVAAGA